MQQRIVLNVNFSNGLITFQNGDGPHSVCRCRSQLIKALSPNVSDDAPRF